MKILIIRQDHLGDLVLTTPLIRSLGKAGHDIVIVCRRAWISVLGGNPYINQLLALEDLVPDFPCNFINIGRAIREIAPDVILLPHAKPLQLLLGARAGHFGKIVTMWGGIPSRLLLCDSLRSGLRKHARHYSEIMLDFARSLGVKTDGLYSEIFLSQQERDNALTLLDRRLGAREMVIIHPGCGGSACNLPITGYAELVDRFLENTAYGIVLSGIAAEKTLYEPTLSRFQGNPRVWNSMGELNLRSFCGAISKSRLLISSSTGPLHLAAGLKIPTVTSFCAKIGLCSSIWGNLGATNVALEPPSSFCSQRKEGIHCDFKGAITIDQIYDACSNMTLNDRLQTKE